MSEPSANKIKQIRDELRELMNKELAIQSRRKQIFDLLVAEYGDETEARRHIRTLYYEMECDRARKTRNADLEFLYDPDEEDDADEGGGKAGTEEC